MCLWLDDRRIAARSEWCWICAIMRNQQPPMPMRFPGSILVLIFLAVCSSTVPADESPRGRYLGVGYDDPSGDSPYGPLTWCGERLWVEANDGHRLIDPATGKVLWQQDARQQL